MGAAVALSIILVACIPITTLAQKTTFSLSKYGLMETGWQDSPNQRGTLTILWSCLSTVIACTWTILHLNVPATCDKTWQKILRKAKWMLVTVLFPEFLFSKAVCELQMAIDDLYAMKNKQCVLGVKFQWEVEEFGLRVRFLHKLFHLFPNSGDIESGDKGAKKSVMPVGGASSGDKHVREKQAVFNPSPNSNESPICAKKTRIWTLTHSYFANMGGFARYRSRDKGIPCEGASCEEEPPNPITAYALINCCVGKDHDPLPDLYLEKDDIDDKAKADWFLKSIAVGQISWLLLSVIVRAASRLPITQLEICTSAFSLLAIATYLANWSKPKDIGRPVQFRIMADTYHCEAWKYYGEPYLRRLYWPSQGGKADVDGQGVEPIQPCNRIGNDFVRLEGFLPPMNVTMAISTAIFGGLHCLAWNFAFPTKTEMMIWMVASVLSATIPLAALLANIVVVSRIRSALSKFADELSKEMHKYAKSPVPGNKCSSKIRPMSPAFLTRLEGSDYSQKAKQLCKFYYDLANFICWGIRYESVFRSCDNIRGFRVLINLEQRKTKLREELSELGFEAFKIEFLLSIMDSKQGMEEKKKALKAVIDPCNVVAKTITFVGGTLYALVRVILLSLAFCALRYVPEGVYITSWTRFLPNIS